MRSCQAPPPPFPEIPRERNARHASSNEWEPRGATGEPLVGCRGFVRGGTNDPPTVEGGAERVNELIPPMLPIIVAAMSHSMILPREGARNMRRVGRREAGNHGLRGEAKPVCFTTEAKHTGVSVGSPTTSRPGRYEGPALGLYNISKVLPWVPLPQKVTARRLPGPFRSARWW